MVKERTIELEEKNKELDENMKVFVRGEVKIIDRKSRKLQLIFFQLVVFYIIGHSSGFSQTDFSVTIEHVNYENFDPEMNDNNNNMIATKHNYTNSLIHESSPYLLQHAHNPVNWFPWGQDALDKAQSENKLIIISIGYAACHWCHVMERESFENEEVAKFMNDNFVAIKVDREERPDIDQVYLKAVQLMTGRGGWPLNCIALPDGRPLHGGTYFSKVQWIDMLSQVLQFVKQNPKKAEQHAESIVQGVQSNQIISISDNNKNYSPNDLHKIFDYWKTNIDYVNGGFNQAPKFPLPIGYQFLLQYSHLSKNKDALNAVTTTLDKMANGGIYDQIGGGFARYSTDLYWKVPHFEKMLYDNAQLVSLYASTYQLTKNKRYRDIVIETLDFIEREMTSPEGGFYSSLDADSEGEEGRFYVWRHKDLKSILKKNSELIIDYYNVTELGNWENDKNILFKLKSDKDYARIYNISESQLVKQILNAKQVLLKERNRRVRPALDDKILTSWNALMLKAYIDAYKINKNSNYLDIAIENAQFILTKVKMPDNRLNRNFKNGKATINAFLDDYAFTIEALISLYQTTFDEKWLIDAQNLLEYSIEHFYDNKSGMFFYTSDIDQALIARKMELADNVIPSSNSQMAINLFILGNYFFNNDYIQKSKIMLNNIKEKTLHGGTYYANWDILMGYFINEPYEVAIVGDDFETIRNKFDNHYLPNVFLSGGSSEGALSLLKGKLIEDQTTIYVCKEKKCNLPTTDVNEALKQIL